jgi:uncharacterized repeat protein (TIGR03803 family)
VKSFNCSNIWGLTWRPCFVIRVYLILLTGCIASLASAPAPLNDLFSNAETISGVNGTITQSNDNATDEPNEPVANQGGQSVWFKWTAPVTGSITFRLQADFNSQLAIFTGNNVQSLVLIAENDSTSLGGDLVRFSVFDRIVYFVRVTGKDIQTGTFKLIWEGDPVYERVFSFTDSRLDDSRADPKRGSAPAARLLKGRDGNLYGTTSEGGLFGGGTVFRVTPEGLTTTLAEFPASTSGTAGPGCQPSGLTQGLDGKLYGTTKYGGTKGLGSVFRVTSGGFLTNLVEFTGEQPPVEGANPDAGLELGRDGNFYGTTLIGGTSGFGTVFRVSPEGTFTKLVDFTGNGTTNKGFYPSADLLLSRDGSFYGGTSNTLFRMTQDGLVTTLTETIGLSSRRPGAYGVGTSGSDCLIQASNGDFYGASKVVFKMRTDGTPNNTAITVLTPESSGWSGLLQGSDGSYYATLSRSTDFYYGGIFQMRTDGTPSGTTFINLIKFFPGSTDNGLWPGDSLVEGNDGNFYGTTFDGGPAFDTLGQSGYGTIFRMTPAGASSKLVDFTGAGSSDKGSNPIGSLTQGSDGNFYGTTYLGANDTLVAVHWLGNGTVYRMTPAGELSTLIQFRGDNTTNTGSLPNQSLLPGRDGKFYGTTSGSPPFGGPKLPSTFFCITPEGTLTTLIEGFDCNGLIQANDGSFYGTTRAGGTQKLGTVFKVVTDGTRGGTILSTIAEFGGVGVGYKGANPSARLTLGGDGALYGTTFAGGLGDKGTVFRITLTGLLTTLIDFGENDFEGGNPQGALILDSDGSLFGTTSESVFRLTTDGSPERTVVTNVARFSAELMGRFNPNLVIGPDGNLYGTTKGSYRFNKPYDNGTIFRLTRDGVFTTLYAPVENRDDYFSSSELINGSDKSLYGTTAPVEMVFSVTVNPMAQGALYRLVFPGMASLIPQAAKVSRNSVVLQASVCAHGSFTTVLVEYGTDGVSFPNSVAVASNIEGYSTALVGTTLTGLTEGIIYYYRFRASNDLGPVQSEIKTFFTQAPPSAVLKPVSGVKSTSAQLNAVVNAKNYDTIVLFEWGTNENSFPNVLPAIPNPVRGSMEANVSALLPGLTAGETYYFRIMATNTGGVAITAPDHFRTRTAPKAQLIGARPVSPTRANVEGTVDALGSEVRVVFEYGTNEMTFSNSETATPEIVSGEGPVPVAATLRGLMQGSTYFYRIAASGEGGSSLSRTNSFTLNILSGLTQRFPDPPPLSTGAFTVNLEPVNKGAWRFAGEQQWRTSGTSATNLAPGTRLIEFLPLLDFIRPPDQLVEIINGTNQVREHFYYETPISGTGSLIVRLKPENLASEEVPNGERAQWRLIGEAAWRNSNTEYSGLPSGNYLIECKQISGRITPPPTSVTIVEGIQRDLPLTYFLANDIGTPPEPLTFAEVSENEDLPFAYVGQIRSEVGSSTGFVVKRRVVATAGHVVFDDGAFTNITKLQWLFQRHSTSYEPTPQIPRGYYLAGGYAAQRAAEGTPGISTPASQHLDYAVLYFLEEAGRGGFGGFLASESESENEFLDSPAEKRLVGYAIDGIAEQNLGKLHSTPVFTNAFLFASGETWTTTAVRGVGGCSGGPLFVKHSNGSFYPAAIYLGGSKETVVRAIDRDVIELFDRAETSANGGGNNTSGGITHTEVTAFGSTNLPGSLTILIEPEQARLLGGWRFVSEKLYRAPGEEKANLSPGIYEVEFKPVAGLPTPSMITNEVVGGKLTSITFTYIPKITGIHVDEDQIEIRWVGSGTLQSSVSIKGSWSDIRGARSPYQTPLNGNGNGLFFRVRGD